MKKKMQK